MEKSTDVDAGGSPKPMETGLALYRQRCAGLRRSSHRLVIISSEAFPERRLGQQRVGGGWHGALATVTRCRSGFVRGGTSSIPPRQRGLTMLARQR